MMSGVRASSIRIESTSSTIAYDKPALHALRRREHHVVAQVVEAELVVRPVGDVRAVRDLLVGVRHLREVHADGHAEELVDPAHPVGVARSEVVVHRHDVHALAAECIQIRGQRRDERLAFAGAHFRDLAVVERDAAQELHVEMPHAERALAGLADDGERLREDVVERRPVSDPFPEFVGLGPKGLVGEGGNRRLERVDRANLLTIGS